MKQSYIFILTILSFAFVTMGLQCNKDYPEAKPVYEYEEKLTLTPYKKTYAIGDTIWMQFQTTDKSLFDKLSGTRIPTDSIFLQVLVNFAKRYPAGFEGEWFGDATVDNGLDVSFVKNVLTFKTGCSNNYYFFRAGFVPKKAGVYLILPRGFVSPCQLALPYSTFKFTFDLADCNKDVWLSLPPQSRTDESTGVMIDNKEMYVFKAE